MPLPLAATPPPLEMPTPLFWPSGAMDVLVEGPVETFDPVGRAQLIAQLIPRSWSGSFRRFDGGAPLPAQIQLERVTPLGQMVDLRGRLSIGDAVTPVQGVINAKSDQLDLVLLSDEAMPGLEAGAAFQGLQGLSLSGWNVSRLTDPGGRLQLSPASAVMPGEPGGATIRGLW